MCTQYYKYTNLTVWRVERETSSVSTLSSPTKKEEAQTLGNCCSSSFNGQELRTLKKSILRFSYTSVRQDEPWNTGFPHGPDAHLTITLVFLILSPNHIVEGLMLIMCKGDPFWQVIPQGSLFPRKQSSSCQIQYKTKCNPDLFYPRNWAYWTWSSQTECSFHFQLLWNALCCCLLLSQCSWQSKP